MKNLLFAIILAMLCSGCAAAVVGAVVGAGVVGGAAVTCHFEKGKGICPAK